VHEAAEYLKRGAALAGMCVIAGDGLEMTPTLAATARKQTVDESTDLQVHSEADLDAFMRDASGFHFEVSGQLSGSAGSGVDSRPGSGPAIAIGPVLWTARLPSLARNGHDHDVLRDGQVHSRTPEPPSGDLTEPRARCGSQSPPLRGWIARPRASRLRPWTPQGFPAARSARP